MGQKKVKTFTDEQNERIRRAVARLVDDGRTRTAVAQLLGVDQPQISQLLNENAGVEPPLLDAGEWVQIARRARDEAQRPRLIVPPVHLAVALNIPLTNHVPRGAREVTDGRRIWFRRHADPRVEGPPIFHGIAHVIAARWGYEHREADAWGIAIELIWPMELALRAPSVAAAVRLQPHAPTWMITAALETALERLRSVGNAGFPGGPCVCL